MEVRAEHQRKNRDRLQIVVDILEVAKDSTYKTRIMYQANLSSALFRRYLEYLTRSGLIDVREGRKRSFVTTEKGRRFLEEFQELLRHTEIAEAKRRMLERELEQVESKL